MRSCWRFDASFVWRKSSSMIWKERAGKMREGATSPDPGCEQNPQARPWSEVCSSSTYLGENIRDCA